MKPQADLAADVAPYAEVACCIDLAPDADVAPSTGARPTADALPGVVVLPDDDVAVDSGHLHGGDDIADANAPPPADTAPDDAVVPQAGFAGSQNTCIELPPRLHPV